MSHLPRKPAEKIQATKTPPPRLGSTSADKHDEGMIDEAIDASFPASDPPAIASPSGTMAVKKVAQSGRDVDPAEPDPKKKKLKPTKK
jgi:hypothetical protein